MLLLVAPTLAGAGAGADTRFVVSSKNDNDNDNDNDNIIIRPWFHQVPEDDRKLSTPLFLIVRRRDVVLALITQLLK
jgi:hypothetical protein